MISHSFKTTQKILLLFIILLYGKQSFAIECMWWQVKVRKHQVGKHQRKDSQVSSHQRREHCREKWKLADVYIKRIVDTNPEGWQSSHEIYKPWSIIEKEMFLKVLSSIPTQYQMENFYFYRSHHSELKSNPASIHLNSRSITLYDHFFNTKNQSSILVHESSHYQFSKLSETHRDHFLELSGWTKVIEDSKISLRPPKVLIKKDSLISPEEDFANYAEVYYESPEKLKSINIKLFQFFKERYK